MQVDLMMLEGEMEQVVHVSHGLQDITLLVQSSLDIHCISCLGTTNLLVFLKGFYNAPAVWLSSHSCIH